MVSEPESIVLVWGGASVYLVGASVYLVGASVYLVGASVYLVGASVYLSLVIIVSPPVPIGLWIFN